MRKLIVNLPDDLYSDFVEVSARNNFSAPQLLPLLIFGYISNEGSLQSICNEVLLSQLVNCYGN